MRTAKALKKWRRTQFSGWKISWSIINITLSNLEKARESRILTTDELEFKKHLKVNDGASVRSSGRTRPSELQRLHSTSGAHVGPTPSDPTRGQLVPPPLPMSGRLRPLGGAPAAAWVPATTADLILKHRDKIFVTCV
jgi:hypothetical protein